VSVYTDTLRELVELPSRLDRKLGDLERENARERASREAEIETYAGEHEAVVSDLSEVLERARREGFAVRDGAPEGHRRMSADPVEHARQLVVRLNEALDNALHTRDALAAEEERLTEEERRRADADRQRREAAARERERQWERARSGSAAIVAAAIAAAAGSTVAMAAIPLVAGAVGLILAANIESTLPALSVQRATGAKPDAPLAPAREARLGWAAFAGLSIGLSGLAASLAGLATGAPSAGLALVGLLAVIGVATTLAVWTTLPRSR
jgi:hypothetical protein